MVVHGDDGLDEITLCPTTTVCEVDNGHLNSFTLDPRDYGFSFCQAQDLVGGDGIENAAIARAVLQGKKGPRRDVVLLNSAVCLYMAGKEDNIQKSVDLAALMIDSGKAYDKLQEFVAATREAKGHAG
jgi:anthranilate phosphoribosyltransferase